MENKINEKVNWGNLLLALGIAYFGVAKWKEYSKIKDIYTVVNSDKSIPSKEESEYIEKIRTEVIEEIKGSNLFKKFNKQYIIDSLSTIQFRVVDSTIVFSENSKACYLYIKPIKGKYKYLLSEPSGENFIIINRKGMKDSNYVSSVVHEIYHYFDKLVDSGNRRYSEIVDISQYVDKNINNENYTKKKIMALMLFVNASGKDENDIVNAIYDDYMSNKEYYTSDNELFARYKTLKSDMLKDGIIYNINQTPTIEDLANYLIGVKGIKRVEHLYLLLSIDLKRLKELDSLI